MTDADQLVVTNSLIQDTDAETSTILYSTAQTVEITFTYNTFICDNSFSGESAYSSDFLDQDEPVTTSSNGMQIENAVKVTSLENSYSQCGIGTRGGMFRLVSTEFYETKSEYFNIAASRGGVLNCQDCYMNLVSAEFYENYAHRGGVIVLSQGANMEVAGCSFQKNTASYSGGVIFVNTESYFSIRSSAFLSNYANSSSVIDVLGSSSTEQLSIYQSRFERNEAIESTISFMFALSGLSSCYFTRNTAEERTKNIFMGFSEVTIRETTFRSTPVLNPAEYSLKDDTQGAFLFVILDVILDMWKTKFLDGTAKLGGAIYLSGASTMTLSNCDMQNNVARINGGGIYGAAYNKI